MEKFENQGEEEKAAQKPELAEENEEITYPVKVRYCKECCFPDDMCEYGPNPKACLIYWKKEDPEIHDDLKIRMKGGNVKSKAKKKKAVVFSEPIGGCKIELLVSKKGRRKITTIISGLDNLKIDEKKVSKKLSKKLATSCSKQKGGGILVMGEFSNDLIEFLSKEYENILPKMFKIVRK